MRVVEEQFELEARHAGRPTRRSTLHDRPRPSTTIHDLLWQERHRLLNWPLYLDTLMIWKRRPQTDAD